MGPRIYRMWMDLSKQWWAASWWWSGATRWLWETNTERMKRHLQEQTLKIDKKLEEYANSTENTSSIQDIIECENA